MSIKKAVGLGLAGNELSKVITGSSEASPGRTAVAVGSGAILGASAAGAVSLVVGGAGLVAAPVTVPLAVSAAIVAGIASLFD